MNKLIERLKNYAIIIMNLVVPMIEYFTTKKFKKEVA